jgi:hypothetical protein
VRSARPRHGIQVHAAVTAAKTAQLTLDHAASRAEVQMAPGVHLSWI